MCTCECFYSREWGSLGFYCRDGKLNSLFDRRCQIIKNFKVYFWRLVQIMTFLSRILIICSSVNGPSQIPSKVTFEVMLLRIILLGKNVFNQL